MAQRAKQKQQTHDRIVEAAARLFREHGLAGAGVDGIMSEAGLTHGGFYAHFADKSALVAEAVTLAQRDIREQWVAGLDKVAPSARAPSIVSRYLNAGHRDGAASGCALPALGGELARQPGEVRRAVEVELKRTLEALSANMPGPDDQHADEQAIGALAACIGGITLARAVADPELSDQILHASRGFILRALARYHGDGGKEARK